MKKSIFILFLFISVLSYSQDNTEITKIKKEISVLFKNADKKNLTNLLTYEIEGKTGLVDAKTLKVILKPTETLRINSLFNPKMKGYYKNIYYFEIDPIDFTIFVEKPVVYDMVEDGSDRSGIEIKSSADGFNGFSTDQNGKLTSYSDLFYNKNDRPRYSVKVFNHNNQFYAIALYRKDKVYKYGIIDTSGATIPNFKFEYENIFLMEKVDLNDQDVWFYVRPNEGPQASFISFKGNRKLENKFGYPLSSSDIFGFNINSLDDKYGILDQKKLDMTIPFQTKLRFYDLAYTSDEVLDTENPLERDKATIYIQVEEGNKKYFIDFNFKKYLPL